MELFVTIVHIIAALFMILVVLLQGGNSGGVGAAFGGGNTQGVFGASGATTFFAKLTYAVAGVFMITSVSLTYLQTQSGKTGLQDKLKEAAAAEQLNNSGLAPTKVQKPGQPATPPSSQPSGN